MKYFILLLLIPTLSFSQPNIPKGTNTIVIKNVSFKEAVNMLLDKGFEIAKIDSNFQTIKTAARESKKYPYGWELTLNLRIKDSALIIKGKGYMSVIGDFDVENRGMKNSFIKASFERTNDFALSFNKPIEYLKQ